MATVIDMPKLSDTMEEGVIAKWNIKEGDTVSAGDIVAEVETDKATMDLEAFDGGTVLKIFVKEGDSVPLGGKLVILGEEGEDISDLTDDAGSDKKSKEKDESAGTDKESSKSEDDKPDKEDEKSDEGDEKSDNGDDKPDEDDEKSDKKDDKSDKSSGKDVAVKESGAQKRAAGSQTGKSVTNNGSESSESRVKASPLARKMAEDRGIDLNDIKGSGPQGRVVKADVEGFEETADVKQAERKPVTAASGPIEDEDVKVSQMRKTIGKRLAESKYTYPHFYETIDIDMKNAVETRTALNEISDVKISFNDLVVKACSVALRQHRWVNSSWMGDVIRLHGEINIAVAVAVDEGLLTPVIRHADQKGLRDISQETKEMAGKARDKKLQPEDWEGSTFTISNLGMFGIEEFTAIINPPNASILAVGAIRDVPVVEDGNIVPGKRMKVTLSSDHRVVDGAKAAEFLNTVRKLLENPASMLL